MTEPIELLLIEDNAADVRLTQEALRDSKMVKQLNVTRTGDEAMDYLYRHGQYEEAVRPNLILLDLNLPGKDGREVLKEIKDDPDLKRIPVIILTTSKAEEDIVNTYNLYANCFVAKPIDFNDFLNVIKSIEDFWLSIARLPPD